MQIEETPQETKFNKKNPSWPLVIILIVAVFGIGYASGQGKLKIGNTTITINRGGPSTSADYSLLWEALDLVNEKYVNRPLDQQKLLYGAVAGMVQAVGDPYTVFFDPEEAKQFHEELQGSFEGIGAEIGIKDEQLVIIAPLPDTPAERAGLLAGDLILAINEEATNNMTTDEAVSKIRGKAGTEVVLSIMHEGKREPEEVRIVRGKIEVKSLTFETKTINDKKIGIIKLNRFGDDTLGLFNHTVDVILAGNYSGIVLDLRNNPGGYLETSIDISSNWVSRGDVVVKEVNFKGEEKDYKASGISRLKGLNTVVLVNAGSASASEIVAGSLQDHKLATLVGEKTFGKGSVQELQDLKNDSALKVTIAKWLTPKGRSINENGLEPDFNIEITKEDRDSKRDPQMDKALDLLK